MAGRLEREQFLCAGRQLRLQLDSDFVACDECHARFLDFQPPRNVPELDGRFGRQVAAQAEPEDSDHRVAGTRDIVYGSGPRRNFQAAAVGAGEHHAVAIQRDDGHFQVELFAQRAAGIQRLGGGSDRAADGRFCFHAVGFEQRRAVVTAVVYVASRIDKHGDARVASRLDRLPQNSRRANALAVVRNDQHIVPVHDAADLCQQRIFELGRNRVADFMIDSQDLVGVTGRRESDEPLLDGRRSLGVAQYGIGVDTGLHQQLVDRQARFVLANHARAAYRRVEAAKHVAHVGRSTQTVFLAVGAQHDDRGFLADAFGGAPGIAIQQQVAEDQDAGPAHGVE